MSRNVHDYAYLSMASPELSVCRHQVVEQLLPDALCRELRLVHRICAVPGYRPGCTSLTLPACPAWAWPALLRARDLVRDAAEEIFDAFGCLWPETTVSVAWWPGSSLPTHRDDCQEYLRKRHISAVVWLSSHGVDFSGGEFFLVNGQPTDGAAGADYSADSGSKQLIRPRAGRAVFFDAKQLHGLHVVSSGERLGLNVWLTRDPAAAEDTQLLVALRELAPPCCSACERLHGRGPQASWPPDRYARELAQKTLGAVGLRLRRRIKRRRLPGFVKCPAYVLLESLGNMPGSVEERSGADPEPALSLWRRAGLALAAFVAYEEGSSTSGPQRSARRRANSVTVKRLFKLIRTREQEAAGELPGWLKRGLVSGPAEHPLECPTQKRRRIAIGRGVRVQHIDAVSGLAVARGFLGAYSQRRLMRAIDDVLLPKQGSASEASLNQAMRFGGDIPRWVLALGEHCARLEGFLSHEVASRRPVFDQLIVNVYHPGQGITRHIDLLKFDDGVIGISLGAHAALTLRRLRDNVEVCPGGECSIADADVDDRVEVALRAGDVYALCGVARWRWTHEIMASSLHGGARRVSLTLRRLRGGSWEGPS